MRLITDEAWATLTIWMEARGEPYEGRVAVAEVIRNRTQLHYESNGTVAGTVLHSYQFSCWNTLDPNRIVAASIDDADPLVASCVQAWREAVAGSNIVDDALLYLDPAILHTLPDWVAHSREVTRVGRHVFYVPNS